MKITSTRVFGYWIFAAWVIGILGGCATLESDSVVGHQRLPPASGYMEVVLEAGQSGNCEIAPCNIYLKTPAGSGDVRIVVNNIEWGSFPPETMVYIGGWDEKTVRIRFPDTDIPQAYVHMPSRQTR